MQDLETLYARVLVAIKEKELFAAQSAVSEFVKQTDDQRYGYLKIRRKALLSLASLEEQADEMDAARRTVGTLIADGPHSDGFLMMGVICASAGSVDEAYFWLNLAAAFWSADALLLPDFLRSEREHVSKLRTRDPGSLPSKYHFICAVRNGAAWITECVTSIRKQSRENFTATIIDDASEDTTQQIAEAACEKDPRFQIIRHSTRRWAVRNIVEAIRSVQMEPEDVVVILDGDDFLTRPDVLNILDHEYRAGAWMTYGSSVALNGATVPLRACPEWIARRGLHRQISKTWGPMHLRTFRRFLFDKIKHEDFRTQEGDWLKSAYDVVLYTPMLEMAQERAVFIDTVLCAVRAHAGNDVSQDPLLQRSTRDFVLNQLPYLRAALP